MATPIKIGETFEETYGFYQPDITSTPAAPVPDLNNPIELTGITITFVIVDSSNREHVIAGAATVPDPLLGVVNVTMTPTQTRVFSGERRGKRFLRFTEGVSIKDKAVRHFVFEE